MRLAGVIVLLATIADARADEGITAGIGREGPVHNRAPPLLAFEPGFDLVLETSDHDTIGFELDPDTRLELTSTWRVVPEDRWRDNDRVRWWRAGGTFMHDFGWALLTIHGYYQHDENELGRGDHVDVGIELSRTHRFTQNLEGFVSLSFTHRQWFGTPTTGELPSDTRAMFATGLRWK